MKPLETMIKAVTQPKDEGYRQIVNDPGASLGKAVLWLAVSGFLGGLFTGFVSWIFGTSAFDMVSQYTDYDIPRTSGSFLSVVTNPIGGAIGAIIGAFLLVGLIHLVSKMLGGEGSFEKMFYASAAFTAPLGLVTSVLNAIPFIRCLTIFVSIYILVLTVIANKVVYGYDTGKAVIASIAPVLVVFLFCCCIVVIFGSLFSAVLGPGIGDVFQNITNNLQ